MEDKGFKFAVIWNFLKEKKGELSNARLQIFYFAMSNGTRCAKWPLTITLAKNERWALASCYISCSVCSVMGNVLVIFAILATKRLRTQANLLVVNLCFADLLVGCLAVPCSAYGLWKELKDRGNCAFDMAVGFVVSFCCSASILLLLLLSIDRYLRIVHFNKFKIWMAGRRTTVAVVCLWVFVAVLATLFILDVKNGIIDICMVGIAFLSFIVMVCLYLLIFRTVAKQSSVIKAHNINRPSSHSESVQSGQDSKRKKKSSQTGNSINYHMHIAKSFLIINVTFFVCWTPFMIVLVLRRSLYRKGEDMHTSIYHWCLLVGYINSLLNPIIYNARNRGIRGRIKELFRGSPQ